MPHEKSTKGYYQKRWQNGGRKRNKILIILIKVDVKGVEGRKIIVNNK